MMLRTLIIGVFLMALPLTANAGEGAAGSGVDITKGTRSVKVATEDGDVEIMRNQDTKNVIEPGFAKTSRKCPPFCIQPMEVAPGVKTVGELEVIDFLKNKSGILVDARTQDWHLKGTIPGSVNIPYTEIVERKDELEGKAVCVYCNGPWCGQSPTAIKALLKAGYPADKILYYRGGVQNWKLLGLTMVEGSV